ncbi:MAG: PEGA domain-containing protein [Phycisphaeraceae bacterium]|nr:MAG: PEGA domain-containing protein [Phycisphaeraceae bacterium]
MRRATLNPVRRASTASLIVAAGALFVGMSGCASERRIFITSEPSGAVVVLNDVEIGRTPVDIDFTWFGVYDVRLRKEGYEPLITSAKAEAPAHEWPGFDLIAETLPVRFKTHVQWHFELAPSVSDPDEIIARARNLRRQVGAELAPDDPRRSRPPTDEGLLIERDADVEDEPPVELPPLLPPPTRDERSPR